MWIDRRQEFKDVPWQQGRLLLTNITRRWDEGRRIEEDCFERRMAFVSFSSRDEGRSRILVFRYETPEECAAEVALHNTKIIAIVPARHPIAITDPASSDCPC